MLSLILFCGYEIFLNASLYESSLTISGQRKAECIVFPLIEHNSACGHCQLFNQDYKDEVEVFSNFMKYLRSLPEYEQTFKRKWKP